MKYTDQEDFAFTLNVQGAGRPYRIDCWNAKAEEAGCYRIADGCTSLDITLAPGQAALYAIDLTAEEELHAVATNADCVVRENGKLIVSAAKTGTYEVALSDGTTQTVNVTAAEDIALPLWDLTVEDWNEGEKKVIVEDRGLGIVTNEVYYETKKTNISVGKTDLRPWKDIREVGPDVSGVGYYTTTVNLPDGPAADERIVLSIGSTNTQTCAVYVNGEKADNMDMNALTADVTELLKQGDNEIRVEVSSSLNNRLLARGYYDRSSALSMQLADNANNANVGEGGAKEQKEGPGPLFHIQAHVRDYGMTGEVKLIRCGTAAVE